MTNKIHKIIFLQFMLFIILVIIIPVFITWSYYSQKAKVDSAEEMPIFIAQMKLAEVRHSSWANIIDIFHNEDNNLLPQIVTFVERAIFLQGKIQYQLGNYDEAKGYFSRVINRVPKSKLAKEAFELYKIASNKSLEEFRKNLRGY